MRKLVLVLAVLLMSTFIFAQKGIEKKASYFVNAAVEEFKLSEQQGADLHVFYLDQLKQEAAVKKQVKAEEVSKEDAKLNSKEQAVALKKKMVELTGKKPAEVQAFLKKFREELKIKNQESKNKN